MRLTPSPEQAAFAAVLHDLLAAADHPPSPEPSPTPASPLPGAPTSAGPLPGAPTPAGPLPGAPTPAADPTTPPPPAGSEVSHPPRDRLGATHRTVWSRLADAGVTGLAVPARWGGAGAEPADLVIACEEIGHHAVPGPVAESVAAVPALLAALGEDSLADKWLPELAAGRLLATLAAAPWLPYAADADTAGLVLLAEPPTVRLAHCGAAHRSMDPSRWLFEARPGPVLATGPAADAAIGHALNLGVLACSAQLLGAGRALLEAAVRYATERTQFGRPIGQFQAVQQQLADAAVGLEFARPLLYAAAVALSGNAEPPGTGGREPLVQAARDVSAAKVACGDAAHRAARAALQVHGAVGYTEEHGLGRWLTKVRVLTLAWGTAADHRARVMRELT